MFEESSLHIGYIVCVVTAVGFVCSLTYNHGYFWHFEAGVRILSIGDILTSYSLWVPGLGTLFFGYSLDLFLQRLEQEEASKIKKHKKLIAKILSMPHILLLIAFICVVLATTVFGYEFRPIIIWFAGSYLWVSLVGILFATKLFKSRTNRFTLGVFIYIPVILSLMFALGLDKSLLDGRLHHPNANIFFIHAKETPEPIILLRHLERGLLTKEVASKNFQLFLWEDISSIEVLGKNVADKRHKIMRNND